MATAVEEIGAPAAAAVATPVVRQRESVVSAFLSSQSVNSIRHVAALRPFRSDEFGTSQASPSEAHVQAANRLITRLRRRLQELTRRVSETSATARRAPSTATFQALLGHKEGAGTWVRQVEKVWDFYFELFGQRQGRFADWLHATDRIALDCYQAVYTGVGTPRSVPSPAPFTFMATGFTPATVRRGVLFSRLGKRGNPFPVVELPYSRLINPWTLGAVHHEVSHNLQWDLGLWQVVPDRLQRQLLESRVPPPVAAMWARWNKEIWADLAGVLLCGPGFIPSLIDVVALPPANAQNFNPAGVHPTPYLRVLIDLELLRRMGFAEDAEEYRRLWEHLYPRPDVGTIPRAVLQTFGEASRKVVDAICFQPYRQLGRKSLAEVIHFTPIHNTMIAEAAGRIATGTDPGILPERFLVGAIRLAFDQRLAPPTQLMRNFYRALGRK